MKILLSYSHLHYHPNKTLNEQKHWGSSASVLARTLYDILKEIGEVTYIDAFSYKPPEKPQKYDIFIGIDYNFSHILLTNKIKKSIYFAVNMHPIERNEILRSFVDACGLSGEAYSGWDMKSVHETKKSLQMADYIVCIGTIQTYNSYIKNGIPKSKIKALNYGVSRYGTRDLISKTHVSHRYKFVYVSSEIGLRKGFDIIYALFTDPTISTKNFHLDIIGSPANSFYEKKLQHFRTLLGDKVNYRGWIKSHSRKYFQILRQNDFVIFPSLEEGQAGSVLDCLQYGLVPILTAYTGIDFSPLGVLETKIDSRYNTDLLQKVLLLKKEEIQYFKNKTVEYYGEFHQDYRRIFKDTVNACMKDELYPKLSVILPIYNKEKTITSLLWFLHKACEEYGNIDLQILFDGCKDKTEPIVRKFLQRERNYSVTYQITSNIFEIKTNNIGLKKSKGKYCIIVQDDNYIYDRNIFYEIVSFMDNNDKAVILGCLAGVNYYPRGVKELKGKGQININDNETYWRQDAHTDPSLKYKIFEVDACMRGPLVIRKSFLQNYGYLDEAYAPLHQDDMDLCFRARNWGFKVYCMLTDVENKSLTVNSYDPKMTSYWMNIYKRNTDIFYSRWRPSTVKNYLWIWRTAIYSSAFERYEIVLRKRKEKLAEQFTYIKDRVYVKGKSLLNTYR